VKIHEGEKDTIVTTMKTEYIRVHL